MLNEQRWLPQLEKRLPLAIPAPVRIGVAQAAFFEALHQPAPADAPSNPYRGVRLSARADGFADRLRSAPTQRAHRKGSPDRRHRLG